MLRQVVAHDQHALRVAPTRHPALVRSPLRKLCWTKKGTVQLDHIVRCASCWTKNGTVHMDHIVRCASCWTKKGTVQIIKWIT